jgi:tungstate transport system substrate-binding protein
MKKFIPAVIISISLALVLLAFGCGNAGNISEGERSQLILATTTSVLDSGILDELVARFEKDHPYRIKSIAVGSGAALLMARQGEADVTLTHEPRAEQEFMDAGYGESKCEIMYNDFIIVGPSDDPAAASQAADARDAFERIAASGSPFLSRGDASGTNAMELSVWQRAGITPGGDWYRESGQGMGYTLRMADSGRAYTLSDRATFIVLRNALDLEIILEGDPELTNHYSCVITNPTRFPGINYQGARGFRDFLLQPDTQRFIDGFGIDTYREHLFYAVNP